MSELSPKWGPGSKCSICTTTSVQDLLILNHQEQEGELESKPKTNPSQISNSQNSYYKVHLFSSMHFYS